MVSLNASVGVVGGSRRGRGRGRSSRGGSGILNAGGSRRRRGRGRSSRGGAAPAPLSPSIAAPSSRGGSSRRQRKQRKHTRRTYRGGMVELRWGR